MTKTAEAGELAKHLMEFLDDVKAGHEVLVTRGHNPVARLVPMHSPVKRQRRSVLHIRSLPGKWIGEAVIKGGDLADEMFARE
ncbi:MAG: type II toxin-antitoxin system Phd/YefM family antitoxin [Verrucomicrobia bacterium]|nr:type II toxin-antitoxin system Phd/YefM family antitoxin [Verrucomicrobiota bacterium]